MEKTKTEFKGEYLGGHAAFPQAVYIRLQLEENVLRIHGLNLDIPYKAITEIKNVTKQKIDTDRVLLLGILGALWKKEELYLVLTYADSSNMSQSMVFKIYELNEAQPAIYAKVVAAKTN